MSKKYSVSFQFCYILFFCSALSAGSADKSVRVVKRARSADCGNKRIIQKIESNIIDFSSDSLSKNNKSDDRAPEIKYKGTKFPTLTSWIKACNHLPKNRSYNLDMTQSAFVSLGKKGLDEVAALIIAWMDMIVKGPIEKDKLWHPSNDGESAKPDLKFFDISTHLNFMPYAQKLIAQPEDQFYFRGDLHGDIFSILEQLKNMQKQDLIDDKFRIIPENVWMIFLGDYVDRGRYGCEVFYTLLRLSLANPDRVVLVRGNHEDKAMQLFSQQPNFRKELSDKFAEDRLYWLFARIYDFLPVVLYVGCQNGPIVNYLQCCHGGIEIGYSPKAFLDNLETQYQKIGILNKTKFVKDFVSDALVEEEKKKWFSSINNILSMESRTQLNPSGLGFLWSDFDVVDQPSNQVHSSTRGEYCLSYGASATEEILLRQSSVLSKIIGIFRGHQHGDPAMMQKLISCCGVYQLWKDERYQKRTTPEKRFIQTLQDPQDQSCVVTFNVGPDSEYGNRHAFDFDTYAALTVKQKLCDWTLEVFNTQVMEPVIQECHGK